MAFLLSATPWKIVEEYPREYTIQMRWGAYMWHTRASLRSALEVKMYDLACEVRDYEETTFNTTPVTA